MILSIISRVNGALSNKVTCTFMLWNKLIQAVFIGSVRLHVAAYVSLPLRRYPSIDNLLCSSSRFLLLSSSPDISISVLSMFLVIFLVNLIGKRQ